MEAGKRPDLARWLDDVADLVGGAGIDPLTVEAMTEEQAHFWANRARVGMARGWGHLSSRWVTKE